MNATIIGAGAWGTAVAIHAAKSMGANGRVVLWARDPEQAKLLQVSRVNQKYLPGVPFPENLIVESSWDLAVENASAVEDLLIIATPLSGLANTCQQLLCATTIPKNWIWLCKGIEPETSALPHEIVKRELTAVSLGQVAYGVLSGPSFAIEVAKGLPCALTVASQFPNLCRLTQVLLHHQSMRVYATDDVVGVELGGAIKNVLAIATGIGDGLGLGLNARAGLITRGMVEMMRLGQAMGAKSETFSGLTGLGDLILTATGDLSRNRKVGLALASGKNLDQILKELGHVAEGVRCAQAIQALAMKHDIQMPIVESVCDVLFAGVDPKIAVSKLMSRDPKAEND